MCELLGMSCNTPTDIAFSFHGFSRRGGGTSHHKDGWGICMYDGPAAHVFREPEACHGSELAQFVKDNPIKTKLAIAHIRKTTKGAPGLRNTHPFQRELWGKTWVFAHNGTISVDKKHKLDRFMPIGSTDSEWAFCVIMNAIARHGPKNAIEALRKTAAQIAKRGTFNFLLSDGTTLYARCQTRLSYVLRKHPFTQATLQDDDVTIDFRQHTTPKDRVAIVATRPLTKNETWTAIAPAKMVAFRGGRIVPDLST